ncbi:PX domain-containing protein kinase-like protein [Coniochaeta hoffmannii]|uniref:PX domain-containing protein kinase-like protein n=1 Tax=Coniochaeta hoffmannii TaxID=91930 RepID=A0AA38R4Z9_9PEZI|nr:PX domain-containing protein kinase-like protein [Coniochaeta hoffmannii]
MNTHQVAKPPGAALRDDEANDSHDKTAVPSTDAHTSTRKAVVQRTQNTSVAPTTGRQNVEDIQTKIFQFLATATPGAIGGVAVGLAATTYLLLGKVGLLLIGAFGGITAFIQWEGRNPDVARAVRGERGVDLLDRLLAEKADRKRTAIQDGALEEEETALAHGFDDFRPETRAALEEMVDAVIRDYVKWWYTPIMPSDKFFPLACRKVLTSFLVSVSGHLSRKRPADAFLDFLTNCSSIVIVFFSELSAAFSELSADSGVSPMDAVYEYLASNPESNLSNLLSQRQQAGKFRMVAEDLLNFLERQTYECDPARVFLREILAGVILETTLQTCSKPEWINGWIVYLLEAGEPDFSQAIDVGMQTGPGLDTAFVDIDGNVGNIGLSKGNKNSFELEKARRREASAHKKKLSKADEEMELAMEEMKRMNQMIAEEEARRAARQSTSSDRPESSAPSQSVLEGAVVQQRESERFSGKVNGLDQTDARTGRSSTEAEPRGSVRSERPSPKDVLTDGAPSRDSLNTPRTPNSMSDFNSQQSSPQNTTGSRFTSFDQIVPPAHDEDETGSNALTKPVPLTLHNATITVLDEAGDSRIRMKPGWDYLVQIEPATTQYPGWMIVRKYSDFEPLHEVLRRIASISGATSFTEQHKDLPNWKVHTRSSLRGELERYLRDACRHQPLAESEGMRKFLERDDRMSPGGPKMGLQAFEKLGKNVFDVLTSAPLEGSRAVVGGVTGVLGNIGLGQRKSTSSSLQDVTAASRLSMSTPPRMDSSASSVRKRDSIDSQRSSIIATQPGKMAPMERRPSYQSQSEAEPESLRPSRSDRWERPSLSGRSSREHSRASSLAPLRSPSVTSLDATKLPPPPDAMPDDYQSPLSPHSRTQDSFSSGISPKGHSRSETLPTLPPRKPNGTAPARKPAKQHQPLSEQETRVAVELLFAIVNELYTLSSAWNIRRTLLAAAKSFLLRPGNPSLISIQSMLQTSVIEANASDAGIASHLRKLRENTLPTEEERAAWPAEMTAEEKEKLRVKARKLLIESGVPVALTGVMGQNATAEALGRVFDCLQEEKVARGLMFGIMLQAVRIVTH